MIGFAGLSHLGIVSSCAAAAKGFEVVAYDPDPELCAGLSRGRLPVHEPGLHDLLEASRSLLRFSADPGALVTCDLILFSIDVPTDRENRSDASAVSRLVFSVADQAPVGAVFVVLSQVPPGFTRRLAADVGRSFPEKGYQVFCQVETLVFGHAVERAMSPERHIVGKPSASASLPASYQAYLSAWPCPVLTMRYESAELAKISINMYLASSVSVANTMAELCEAIGADWGEIAPALRRDRRIGPHAYLSPGLGLSGGNLERDLVTVQALAREHGTDAGVVDAWFTHSVYRRDWVLRVLHALVLSRHPGATVALWGLAYKPDTHSTKNSPALALIEVLRGFGVRAHDPRVVLDAQAYPGLTQVADPLEACRGAEALVIMTPWPSYASITPDQIRHALTGRTIIDPFGVLQGEMSGVNHARLGVPSGAE